jgi:hypothetical protein
VPRKGTSCSVEPWYTHCPSASVYKWSNISNSLALGWWMVQMIVRPPRANDFNREMHWKQEELSRPLKENNLVQHSALSPASGLCHNSAKVWILSPKSYSVGTWWSFTPQPMNESFQDFNHNCWQKSELCECGEKQDHTKITHIHVLWWPAFTEWSTLTNQLAGCHRWDYNGRHLPQLQQTEHSNIHYFKNTIRSTFEFHLFMLYLIMLSIALIIQC